VISHGFRYALHTYQMRNKLLHTKEVNNNTTVAYSRQKYSLLQSLVKYYQQAPLHELTQCRAGRPWGAWGLMQVFRKCDDNYRLNFWWLGKAQDRLTRGAGYLGTIRNALGPTLTLKLPVFVAVT
jgi:hypothetical protein